MFFYFDKMCRKKYEKRKNKTVKKVGRQQMRKKEKKKKIPIIERKAKYYQRQKGNQVEKKWRNMKTFSAVGSY